MDLVFEVQWVLDISTRTINNLINLSDQIDYLSPVVFCFYDEVKLY